MKPAAKMSKYRKKLALSGSSLVLAVAALVPSSFAFAESAAVGEVSLVLGKAFLETAEGNRHELTSGDIVHATDRIQTGTNGHVHIRFVDEGLVSVRPDSRLEIQRYEYNPDQPDESAIRLLLEEGVTRSISGHGAKAARERFRLNTPIAAIGVRGTDFVVSSDPGSVRAQVNEGAIVLAPFSDDCTADSLGPCSSNAVELAQSAVQMIELDQQAGMPRLMTAQMQRDANGIGGSAATQLATNEDAAAEDETVNTNIYRENFNSQRVQDVENSVAAVEVPDVTPTEPVDPPALVSRQLVWGRWSGEDLIALSRDEMPAGLSATISSLPIGRPGIGHGDYTLYRDDGGSDTVQPNLGQVSFTMNSAQAYYHHDQGQELMAVSGGVLDMNFDNNTFSTEVNMSHKMTGDVDFSAEGRINPGGYFNARSETERMAGAVSLDGLEAGYFFEKQLESGGIQGLTLWDQQ